MKDSLHEILFNEIVIIKKLITIEIRIWIITSK